jgi:hypothetical protein
VLLPLAYSVIVLTMLLFHPEMIDKIPVGPLWEKQLVFSFIAIAGWLAVSFQAVQSR